jgi:twitching motility protein PilT
MPQIDRLFDLLLGRGGSDLHLSPGYPPMLRVKGELVAGADRPLTAAEIIALTDEILTPAQRAHFAEAHDLDFAYAYGAKARFRGNYLEKTTGRGAVFRTIPTKILTLDELGVPAGVRKLADLTAGLVLVTGPTGSGKSTTLAAMIDHMNKHRRGHILTIEDPVEFVHQPQQCLVTHKEVGVDVPSFLEAIRSAGRENADVILVGELRGAETMKLALQLASFGILILATVHTNSAAATIDRFVNAFPADQQPQIRGLLADSLAGVVAQQLLRRADGSGPGRGPRDPDRQPGADVAHPRGQDQPDRQLHPERAERGHAAPARCRRRGRARSPPRPPTPASCSPAAWACCSRTSHAGSPALTDWLAAIRGDLGLSALTQGRCLVYATPAIRQGHRAALRSEHELRAAAPRHQEVVARAQPPRRSAR